MVGVQAMVLAAGLGTRLWPLTADRAKPAVPFLGRPLIASIVELLWKHGVDRTVVNTHHLPESIHRALEALESDPRIRFSHEVEIQGTAGALSKAVAEGSLDAERETIIINAKLYTNVDVSRAIARHRESAADVTMVLRTNRDREAFREVLVEEDRVVGFGRTAIPEGEAPLLFTGIHILAPKVLKSIPHGASDSIRDIYPPLIEARLIRAHIDDDGRWWEFSTLERYLGLHRRAAEEALGPQISLSEGAEIEPGAQVSRSVLWEGARACEGSIVADAILGSGVIIPRGASVQSEVVVRRASVRSMERGYLFGDLVRVPIAVAGSP